MTQGAELTQCDKSGNELSLYLNVGSCETPTWIYHKGVVGDLNYNENENPNEQSSRDPAQLVRQYVGDKIDIEISGEQHVDAFYEGCNFINSMRHKSAARDICILTGYMSEVGVTGWRGKFRNFDRSVSGPESGPMRQTFMLKPAACVTTACKVRPVQVATANAVADYNPGTFTPTA